MRSRNENVIIKKSKKSFDMKLEGRKNNERNKAKT